MSKQIVHMRIDDTIRASVKKLSEREYGGNFTAAIESLLGQALEVRLIDEGAKWAMYSAAKASIADESISEKDFLQQLTKVTKALHI